MKVIKGEKYICVSGPKKGELFRVIAFTQFHVACENLSDPPKGVEMIPKYYFKESFKDHNHKENVKLGNIETQQIICAINTELSKYVFNGVIPEATFSLMCNDVSRVLIENFYNGEIL
jgi:hypothetical protein